MEKYEESLGKILAHFGKRKQMIKTIEELSELSASLARDILLHDGEITHETVEEMADVKIMIAQLELIIGDFLENEVEARIKRTLKRIEDGYYE